MVAQRLRPAWSSAQLADIYVTPHDHTRFGRGHGERVAQMVQHARTIVLNGFPVRRIADLSCGNAFVAKTVAEMCNSRPTLILGDIAPGYDWVGPIEQTLDQITRVDLFISGETIEHLDDPQEVLRRIGKLTDWLVLSTPTDNWDDSNAEHYWAWSADDVEEMVREAGFEIVYHTTVNSREWGEPYKYGIWTARRTRTIEGE